MAKENPRIIGLMVVGRGEGDRWLDEALTQRRELCDEIVICGNNTDDKTEQIIQKHKCWFYRDDREWGHDQPRIKSDLLARVAKLKPDWVLPSDADEIYDSTMGRNGLNALARETGAIAYYFYIVNLWNDEQHYRKYLSFSNVRFFKYIPSIGHQYENKPVHCGLAPSPYYKFGWDAPYIVKHYGLMKKEDRERKVKRYEKYDPKGIYKSKEQFYDELKRDTTGSPFIESEVTAKVRETVLREQRKPKYAHST